MKPWKYSDGFNQGVNKPLLKMELLHLRKCTQPIG